MKGEVPMGELFTVSEADIHVTTACGSKCEFCYVDPQCTLPEKTIFNCTNEKHGDTDTLKNVITSLQRNAGAKNLVFVGGDPCCHPDLLDLLCHANGGGSYTCVLSNTHQYRNGGKPVSIEATYCYLNEMDFTLHNVPDKHDEFNKTPGSYSRATHPISQFMAIRNLDPDKESHHVGIVLNLSPYTLANLKETMEYVIRDLRLNPDLDNFLVQRIAPAGIAKQTWSRWKITPEMIRHAFETFEHIKATYGIKTNFTIDTLPWCSVPQEYWHYLEDLKGGCNWGQPGGVLSVLPDGTLQRCALCHDSLRMNILGLTNPEAFTRFIMTDPALLAFRQGKHLGEACRQCPLLDRCGGGCVVSNTDGRRTGDPYEKTITPLPGYDYLSQPAINGCRC